MKSKHCILPFMEPLAETCTGPISSETTALLSFIALEEVAPEKAEAYVLVQLHSNINYIYLLWGWSKLSLCCCLQLCCIVTSSCQHRRNDTLLGVFLKTSPSPLLPTYGHCYSVQNTATQRDWFGFQFDLNLTRGFCFIISWSSVSVTDLAWIRCALTRSWHGVLFARWFVVHRIGLGLWEIHA